MEWDWGEMLWVFVIMTLLDKMPPFNDKEKRKKARRIIDCINACGDINPKLEFNMLGGIKLVLMRMQNDLIAGRISQNIDPEELKFSLDTALKAIEEIEETEKKNKKCRY